MKNILLALPLPPQAKPSAVNFQTPLVNLLNKYYVQAQTRRCVYSRRWTGLGKHTLTAGKWTQIPYFLRKEVAHIRHHEKENRYLHRVPAHYYKHLGEIPLLLFLEGRENPLSRLSKCIRPACLASRERCSPPCVHTLQHFYKPHPRVEWCRPNWPFSVRSVTVACWAPLCPPTLRDFPRTWLKNFSLKIISGSKCSYLDTKASVGSFRMS